MEQEVFRKTVLEKFDEQEVFRKTVLEKFDEQEVFRKTVLEKFDELDTFRVQVLGQFDKHESVHTHIFERLDENDQIHAHMFERFEKIESTLDRLVMHFVHLEEQARTHATKDDVAALENRITTKIDNFLKLHLTHDVEISSLRSAYQRLSKKVGWLEGCVGI